MSSFGFRGPQPRTEWQMALQRLPQVGPKKGQRVFCEVRGHRMRI